MSVPPEQRSYWQRLAAAHQCLQLAQKRVYAADRAVAASDFPASEVYMAMDGGSGAEFVLPHMAAHDTELPSKALATFHTLPMKVLNALDQRSHVILSPGCVVAGANHLCECVAIVLNTVFKEHGDIPQKIMLQMDNVNKPQHVDLGIHGVVRRTSLGCKTGVRRKLPAASANSLLMPGSLWRGLGGEGAV